MTLKTVQSGVLSNDLKKKQTKTYCFTPKTPRFCCNSHKIYTILPLGCHLSCTLYVDVRLDCLGFSLEWFLCGSFGYFHIWCSLKELISVLFKWSKKWSNRTYICVHIYICILIVSSWKLTHFSFGSTSDLMGLHFSLCSHWSTAAPQTFSFFHFEPAL